MQLMKRFAGMHLCALIVVFTAVFATFGSVASGQGRAVNIMAGPDQSTAKIVADEIKALSERCGLPVRTHETVGALQNLVALKERSYTQFGIMQSDVLEYLKTFEEEDPAIAAAIRGIRVAFPLFDQEVHVLARREISGLADLNGRVLAVGAENSGTFLTAHVTLDLLGVTPSERRAMAAPEALEKLLDGQIDAMFVVDGTPSALLASIPADRADLHLVPIDDPLIASVYAPVTIPGGTYGFQTEDVSVVAVGTVLLTYNYVAAGRNYYNTDNCRLVADVSGLVAQNLDALKSDGHPKWKDVDLQSDVPDWLFSGCAARGLAPQYKPVCR